MRNRSQKNKKERGIEMSTNEMTNTVRELKELKAFAEQIADEITALEDKIKAEMNSQNVEVLSVGEYTVRYTTVNSSRFNTNEFKKDHTDLYLQYVRPTVSRRFTIA